MKPSLAGIFWGAALSVLACVALAQNSPTPYPTPFKALSPESPRNATNAAAQAEAEYKVALAKCDARPQNERQACANEAEEHFYGALSVSDPGLQGNPAGNTGAIETAK